MNPLSGLDGGQASNDSSALGAALGIVFAHAVNTRLVLEMTSSGRQIRVRHPTSGLAAVHLNFQAYTC